MTGERRRVGGREWKEEVCGGKRGKRRKKLKKEGRRERWETGKIVRCGAVRCGTSLTS